MAPRPLIHVELLLGITFKVYWYGVFLLLGSIVVLGTSYVFAARHPVLRQRVAALWVVGVLTALVGGRLAALALGKTAAVFGPRGLVSAGGLGFAAIGCAMYLRTTGVPLLQGADAFAPAIAFGEAVARVGTLLAGTAFGTPTALPWGVVFTDPLAPARPLQVALHPTQAYLSVGLLIVGIVAARVARDSAGSGRTTTAYLVGSGLLRLVVENLRGDRIYLTHLVSVDYLVGALLAGAGIGLWILHVRTRQRDPAYVL